ncbi:hypothetical protein EVA_21862 [gut metagenome]|uniref:Uncharacterized protein n=1 Tax=gut metagenome TaxID=749906 RepID=J9BR50_9ZZZZ
MLTFCLKYLNQPSISMTLTRSMGRVLFYKISVMP